METKQEAAFRAWIAKVSDEFRDSYKANLLDFVDLKFSENIIEAKFHRPHLAAMAASISWNNRLMLRDAGLGLDVLIGSARLGLMPIGYKTELEVLKEHLPPGFECDIFGRNDLKIIAPSRAAARQLWLDIESIAKPKLIGWWPYLWIAYGGDKYFIEREPIVPLLRRFGQI